VSHSLEHRVEQRRPLAAVAARSGKEDVLRFRLPAELAPDPRPVGRPDEIIDPYHYVEFDASELRELCRRFFPDVRVLGLFGSELYDELVAEERRALDRLLRLDPLRLRRLVPRRLRQRLYDRKLTRERRRTDPRAAAIEVGDFRLSEERLDEAVDLVAICRLA
jgi:hypothetical protein